MSRLELCGVLVFVLLLLPFRVGVCVELVVWCDEVWCGLGSRIVC